LGIIRLLLALSVVITHSAEQKFYGITIVGGQAAVQAFYVISGFYMALVLNRKYGPGVEGYKTFILARIFRLFPAYLFVFGLAILLAVTSIVPHEALGRWKRYGPEFSPLGYALYAVPQFTIIGQDISLFTSFDNETAAIEPDLHLADIEPGTTPGSRMMFVGQAWTLSVEMMFYCIAPFIVRRVWLIGTLWACSWAIRIGLAGAGYHEDPFLYRFFPSELSMFLLGSFAYHVYNRFESNREKMSMFGWAGMIWMMLILLMLFRFEQIKLRSLIVSTSMGLTLPFIFALTRNVKWDRWIGELSYPLYICHELVRLTMLRWMPEHAGTGMFILLSLVAAVLLMVCIEQPFERMRARFVERRNARRLPVAA
jgi:peptidoglycan/LPS O-acetylase OafA/YrhL